jgi:hypothetical protein
MQSPSELRRARGPAESVSRQEETDWLDPVTGDILLQVMTELASMMSILGRAPAGRRITEIQARARAFLHGVARRMAAREIDPWTRLRMSPDEPIMPPSRSPARIGVFPLSASPIHWGHLLSALSAMAAARLDKVAFVISSDSSPATELYPEELRRGAASEAVSLFQPLFTLVPASAGRTINGPASFFRLLGLNGQQMVEAFYIAWSESASGAPAMEIMDALWGRSGASAGYNEKLHAVSLIMIGPRGAELRATGMSQRVLAVPPALPWVSTAAVRSALCSTLRRDEIAALPACAFRHLRMLTAFD